MTPDQLKRIEAMLADTDGLKECPFCASLQFDPETTEDENRAWSINCVAYCEGGCGLHLEGFTTREHAVAAWNTRPYLEPVRALYEDYKRMREFLIKERVKEFPDYSTDNFEITCRKITPPEET